MNKNSEIFWMKSHGPSQRLWLFQNQFQAKVLAWLGLAWPGLWPEAGASTSLMACEASRQRLGHGGLRNREGI
jgi:hypothetical protein